MPVHVPSDYDEDPGRWRSWKPVEDVHHTVAAELVGPVLDVGCAEGRLAGLLRPGVPWVGLDRSATLLDANPHRPLVRADMRALPFGDATFAEVVHLWCLYHVEAPVQAIREAHRVLVPGGRYYACTASRRNDPELCPDGYPPSGFDAEEAVDLVAEVFDDVGVERWDRPFVLLATRDEVRAYVRHHAIAAERADEVAVPLWLTKRGVLVRAVRSG